jgi:hypothetical protein
MKLSTKEPLLELLVMARVDTYWVIMMMDLYSEQMKMATKEPLLELLVMAWVDTY